MGWLDGWLAVTDAPDHPHPLPPATFSSHGLIASLKRVTAVRVAHTEQAKGRTCQRPLLALSVRRGRGRWGRLRLRLCPELLNMQQEAELFLVLSPFGSDGSRLERLVRRLGRSAFLSGRLGLCRPGNCDRVRGRGLFLRLARGRLGRLGLLGFGRRLQSTLLWRWGSEARDMPAIVAVSAPTPWPPRRAPAEPGMARAFPT